MATTPVGIDHHASFGRKLGGDIDGAFGLLVDNLVQLLVIVALVGALIDDDGATLLGQIIPAVGVSVILGNLYYALQAWWASRRDERRATALPYGINTPSVFAYLFFIMIPVKAQTGSWDAAYAAGMIACIGSGFIEFFGAFFARWIRAVTPRAALLSALAGIAITFIAMDFVVRITADPLIGFIPLAILFAGYYGRARMPLGLPAGLVAILVGAALAWVLTYAHDLPGLGWTLDDGRNLRAPSAVRDSVDHAGFYWPDPRVVWPLIVGAFTSGEWIAWLGVIIPMGLFNLVGSLQNLESAAASGDEYDPAPSLMVNGIGSIAGGFLGSCFPTTIYIGHPGWKALGAGWAYSLLNAFAIAAICLTGLALTLEGVIPIAAGAAILLWIGAIMTAQAFNASPPEHGGAVAIGLIPAIAGLIVMIAMAPYSSLRLVDDDPNALANNTPIVETDSTTDPTLDSPDESPALEDAINDAPGAAPDEPTVPEESPALDEAAVADTIPPAPRLTTLQEQLDARDPIVSAWGGYSILGFIRLERGLLLIAMIWAALIAWIIERKWAVAAWWALGGAALSALGVIHAFAIDGNTIYYLLPIPGRALPDTATRYPAWSFTAAYLVIAIGFFIAARLTARRHARLAAGPDDQAAALRREVDRAHDHEEPDDDEHQRERDRERDLRDLEARERLGTSMGFEPKRRPDHPDPIDLVE
ncbi:MAG: NCS2 family permease [Phycisphaerales bacterium]